MLGPTPRWLLVPIVDYWFIYIGKLVFIHSLSVKKFLGQSLSVTQDRIWFVWFLQVLEVLVCQLDLEGFNHLPEVIQLGGADDGSGDLLRAPGEGDLGHLYALLFGEFPNTVDDNLAGTAGLIEIKPGISLGSCCALVPSAGKHTPCKRTPRNAANAKVLKEGEHFSFFFSVE